MTRRTRRSHSPVGQIVVVAACMACSVGPSAACSDAKDQIAPTPPTPSASSSAPPKDAGAKPAHGATATLRRCAVGRRELGSITDALARLSALAPVDGACFVAALPRPLAVVATKGALSAQPADGERSPRLFFLLPKLVVSAVPSGPGSKVLEFGEWVSSSRTIKGEIALPVSSAVAQNAAFTKVADARGTGTTCGGCHRGEQAHPSNAKAFASDAFRPEPQDEITIVELQRLHDGCTRDEDTSERCAMLHAVFDVGQVEQGVFAEDVGTFLRP